MRVLRFVAGLAVAVLVHALGARLVPRFTSVVDLFLVLTVTNALAGRLVAGMTGGLAAGLAADVLSGGLYGLRGFADTMIGYASAIAAQRFALDRGSGVLLLYCVAALVQETALMGLTLALVPDDAVVPSLWLLAKAGSSGVLGLAIYLTSRRLKWQAATWRRRRATRLRL